MKTLFKSPQEDYIAVNLDHPDVSATEQSIELEEVKPVVVLHPDDKVQIQEEKQVILRIRMSHFMRIRIWPKHTDLICRKSGSRSALIHSEGIGVYPDWNLITPGTPFLLIFAPLPPDCVAFDLFEDIPESGGFHLTDIPCNRSGVYDLWLD